MESRLSATMEVNRLLGDELSYEIEIRKLTGTDATVMKRREIVREALRLERLGLSETPTTSDRNPKDELRTCEEKLENLEMDIQDFDSQNKDNEYRRIRTRLVHIQGRLSRVMEAELGVPEKKAKLLNSTEKLRQSLEEVYSARPPQDTSLVAIADGEALPVAAALPDGIAPANHENGSILDEPNILLPEMRHSQTPTRPSGMEQNPDVQRETRKEEERIDPLYPSMHDLEGRRTGSVRFLEEPWQNRTRRNASKLQ